MGKLVKTIDGCYINTDFVTDIRLGVYQENSNKYNAVYIDIAQTNPTHHKDGYILMLGDVHYTEAELRNSHYSSSFAYDKEQLAESLEILLNQYDLLM